MARYCHYAFHIVAAGCLPNTKWPVFSKYDRFLLTQIILSKLKYLEAIPGNLQSMPSLKYPVT